MVFIYSYSIVMRPRVGAGKIAASIAQKQRVRGCSGIFAGDGALQHVVEAVAIETKSSVTWAAAAKPFGTVENFDGETDVATALKSFVVPCFSHTRLVPLDSVGGEDLSTADYGWVTHIRHHLGVYLEHGPANLMGCFYCAQLQAWELRQFREAGKVWLREYSDTCVRGSGGSGGHGGTSHGH